jgi:organic radical activating enzyme
MTAKFFPITTKTSCKAKWAHSTIWLNNATTASCCTADNGPIGDNFDNFHNTEKKIKSRELMLQGQWPDNPGPEDGCKTCQEIEKSGDFSERCFQNSIQGNYPQELNQDPTLVQVDPSVVEVYFSNTCNLKCIYCNSTLSSSIQAEDAKFGSAMIFKKEFVYQDNQYRDTVPKFWSWFETNGKKLQRLQVLGGEPFLQKDVYTLIDHFESNPYPDLEFNIITNLSIESKIIQPRLNKLVESLKKRSLKRVDIQTSIDCWGVEQEYIRDGISTELFDTNMKNMLRLKGLRVGLLSTISSLSIFTMTQLFHKWQEWNQIKKVHWYLHLVTQYNNIFSPLIFKYELFEPSLKYVVDSFSEKSWEHRATKNKLLGIIAYLKDHCSNDVDRQRDLYLYLEENDKRRNSNWRETFPWLLVELEKNNVV